MKMQSSDVFCDLKWYYNEKMLFSFSVDSDFIFWQKCAMPIIGMAHFCIIAAHFQKQF